MAIVTDGVEGPSVIPDAESEQVRRMAEERATLVTDRIRQETAGIGGVAGKKAAAAILAREFILVYNEGRTTHLVKELLRASALARWRLVWWMGGALALSLAAVAGLCLR